MCAIRLIFRRKYYIFVFFFNDTATTEIYTLSLHDALPIFGDRLHALDNSIFGCAPGLDVGNVLLRFRYNAFAAAVAYGERELVETPRGGKHSHAV